MPPFLREDGSIAPKYVHGNISTAELDMVRQRAAQALAQRRILKQGICKRKHKRTFLPSWANSYTLTLTTGQLILAPNSRRGAKGITLDLRAWDVSLSEKGGNRFDLVHRGAEYFEVQRPPQESGQVIYLKASNNDECRSWYAVLSEQCINAQCSMVEEAFSSMVAEEDEEAGPEVSRLSFREAHQSYQEDVREEERRRKRM